MHEISDLTPERPDELAVEPSSSGVGFGGTATDSAVAIRLADVGKSFGDVTAIQGIDLTVARHSRIGIVGPSGGGKTTLLQIVAGLLEPDGGEVSVEGATIAKERLARCALMPQRDLLLPWRTALDNAGIALENRGISRAEARNRTKPLFERFGLARFEHVRPAQLSGGMRQRVSFLRTLMAEKDVLLLDEPFGALDSITRGEMQSWLAAAMDEVPRTVLLVTHDVEEAILLSKLVVVLSARPGRVVRILEVDHVSGGSRREIVTNPAFVALKEQALEALES